jgi:hypothetical protein
MSVQSVLSFGVGFISGWAARSLADTPEGVGVKLLEVGIGAKDKVERWARVEGERLEDMLAEARARVPQETSETNGASKGASNGAPRRAAREAP